MHPTCFVYWYYLENEPMQLAHPSGFSALLALYGFPVGFRFLWFTALMWLVPQVTWAGAITIGSVSIEPVAEITMFSPLARYLAQQLQPEGIDEGRVVVAYNLHQMAAFIREGKVDLYIDSPFPVVAVSQLSESRLLLQRWKQGVDQYHTVLFTRHDSGISRLEDLKGKMVAFKTPFSSSGYFLPKLVLVQAGLRVMPKSEAAASVGPEEVGYVFSHADENTVVWVSRGKVSAGAIDDQRYQKEAKGNLPSLRVIYQTVAIPRHIISYRADLPLPLVVRIKDILIQMDAVEEGKKVLQAFEGTAKFDEIPAQTMDLLSQWIPFINTELELQ